MGEDNEEETSGMERTAFWITKDSNGWSFIWLQLTWSFNILSFYPAVENLLLLLCCQPAWILKRKVLKDRHRLIVRAELIGWSQLHVYIAFAKHTCLVFRTQWSGRELIWSSMLILPSCILGRVRAKWSQGRETSDPIRTSQKTTAMIELNCGFCLSRILLYFPMCVSVSVSQSQAWHLIISPLCKVLDHTNHIFSER